MTACIVCDASWSVRTDHVMVSPVVPTERELKFMVQGSRCRSRLTCQIFKRVTIVIYLVNRLFARTSVSIETTQMAASYSHRRPLSSFFLYTAVNCNVH